MLMKKIEAKIVADSQWMGNRITTYLLTYPRFIHGELMTHRMFSRNSASSRAIPFEKMVKMLKEDPFIPIAWQKDHKGMQGTKYFTEENMTTYYDGKYHKGKLFVDSFKEDWISACNNAIEYATKLYEGRRQSDKHQPYENSKLTKQLCNRLLEPFMWHTVLVTATEWDNFFELRCPKYEVKGLACGPQKSKKDWLDHMKYSSMLHPSQYPKTTEEWLQISSSGAEIHIQALAEAMWDARNESIPKELNSGEWHIPFGDKCSNLMLHFHSQDGDHQSEEDLIKATLNNKLKVATARCARLSYMTFDGEIDYAKDIALHDQLKSMKHFSPFEHCAKVMTADEFSKDFVKIENGKKSCGWCNNFKGFIPYRHIIENELV